MSFFVGERRITPDEEKKEGKKPQTKKPGAKKGQSRPLKRRNVDPGS